MPTQRRTDRSTSSSSKSKKGRPSSVYVPASAKATPSSNTTSEKTKNVPPKVPTTTTVSPILTVAAPTTAKPSYLRSVFNRIWGSIKSVQSLTDYMNIGDNKLQETTTAPSGTCSLAFWTTNVTPDKLNGNEPLTLTANIPASVFTKLKPGSIETASVRSSWFREALTDFQPSSSQNSRLEKVLVFVEICTDRCHIPLKMMRQINSSLGMLNKRIPAFRRKTRIPFGRREVSIPP